MVKAGAATTGCSTQASRRSTGELFERVGYATSADGIGWTKRGVVLGPSLTAYAADETGVEATGMLIDGSTLHVWTSGVDRSGRTRGNHATTAYPTPGSPQPGTPSGWATYQLGDSSTSVRDFRQLVRTSTGSSVALWVSFLQPYSSAGNEFWSEYFPVDSVEPDRGTQLPAHCPRRSLAGPALQPCREPVARQGRTDARAGELLAVRKWLLRANRPIHRTGRHRLGAR